MLAWDAPGPRVTRQTAARPVSFPPASAMWAAAASCRVLMTPTPASQSASSTGRKLSPGTHVHSGTSCAMRHSTSAAPPARALGSLAASADTEDTVGADDSTGRLPGWVTWRSPQIMTARPAIGRKASSLGARDREDFSYREDSSCAEHEWGACGGKPDGSRGWRG